MARAAKNAASTSEALPSVKLFAASSGWPYKPHHTPRDAVILFHGGPQEQPSYVGKAGHVGHRYAPLICALARPEHDNVFIVDLSQVGPAEEWKAEVQRPGRLLKMLEKWFAKFNPVECTAVVCGDDVNLLLIAAHGAREPRFSRAVIVDPQPTHKKILERLNTSMTVVTAQPTLVDIKQKAARFGESGEQPNLKIADLHFVSVEFSLNPQTKQLVQKPTNVTAAAVQPPSAAVAVPADVTKKPEAKSGGSVVEGVMTHHLSLGMSFRGLVVQVLGTMSEGATARVALGDCVGSIEALVPKADQAAMVRGRVVSVAGRVACVQGRQFVVVDRVEGPGDFREGYNPVRMGLRNASERVRRYGVLILRGGQCVLSRRGGVMRIPMREATTQETPEKAATRSAAEACDIYPEEFALLRDVAPAVVYDPPESGPSPGVLTVYAAVAINPPPPGHDEEESEDEDDDYDWFLYDRAVKRLQTVQERKACAVLAQNVKEAVSAGIFVPDLPCTFGPKVLPGDAQQLALADPAAALAPESSPEPQELLPVTVLSGFLGAGKTTLLKHILENVDGLRVAVIVNDMAEVNIDAQLVSSASSMQHQSEKVVEMTNGCICCTLREDLLTSIVELSDQKRFDYVVIESSGISEPLPVAETFTFDHKDTARLLKDVARLDTMVTVVDGVNVLANMQSTETTTSAGQAAYEGDVRAMAQLLVDQIEFANVILLNKCDLLSDVAKAEVRTMLRKLNPEAVVIETTNSVIQPKQVLNTRLFSMDGAEKHEQWLKEARIGEHKPETEEFGIHSFVYRRRRAFHPSRLKDLLWTPGALPSEVMRAKGYLWVKSRPDFVAVLSLVGTQRDMTQGQPWWAAVDHDLWPEGLWEDIKPLWNEKSGDRAQEIVVIGRHDRAEIERLLDACLLTDDEALLDPKEFVDELPKWEEPHDHEAHDHAAPAQVDQPGVAPVDVH